VTRLSVVVPAYREEAVIAATVKDLRSGLEPVVEGGGLELIVVDDGSDDLTATRATEAGADRVIRLFPHRGKGERMGRQERRGCMQSGPPKMKPSPPRKRGSRKQHGACSGFLLARE